MFPFKRKSKVDLVGQVVVVDEDDPSSSSGDVDSSSGSKEKVNPIPSLSTLLRIRQVVDDTVEDYSGVRYGVWRVQGCDIMDGQSVPGWTSFLNGLEFPIQVLIRQHAPDYSDIRRTLIEARPEQMRTGWINQVGNSMLTFLYELEEGHRIVSRRWYVVARADRGSETSSSLNQVGFNASRLGSDELSEFVQACASGMGVGHTEDTFRLKEFPKHLQLSYRFCSMYEVERWPRSISFAFLERMLQMGEEMDISFWVWPLRPSESHSMLQMQRSRFEGARIAAEQKGKLVPPNVELAISDIIRISEGVQRGVSRLYRRTCNIAIYAQDEEALRSIHNRLNGHFRSSIARIRHLKFRQSRAFAAMMPALRPGLDPPQLTDSETMLRMFPFGPRDLDTRQGTLLGMDMRSRTAVFIDPFAPEAMNGHMVVMARSGAGKSFFTKLRVTREALRGTPVYLIDPEGEYGVITQALGGEVFVPGSPGFGLNPFAVRYSDQGDLTRRVASLASLVGVMLQGQVDHDMQAVIDRSLTLYYAHELQQNPPDGRLGERGMESFYDFLHSDAVEAFGGNRLGHLLSEFATGSARFLMRGDARDLLANEAPVTSFNLKNLATRLKPIATSVCAEVVWALAITNPRPRILVVDECWTVLSTPSGAEALLTIVKRARKYQLGLTTITQDVQDFLAEDATAGLIAGHAGRSLLQNSAFKLALQQDPAALPLVYEALGLSGSAARFLAGSQRGEGLLVGSQGDTYPIEIVSTPEERTLVLDRSWIHHGETGPDGADSLSIPDFMAEAAAAETQELEPDAAAETQELEPDAVGAGPPVVLSPEVVEVSDLLLRSLSAERRSDGADT